jgi:Family of unknown function (DUF6600)
MRKPIVLAAALLILAAGIYAQEVQDQTQAQTPPPGVQDQKDIKYTNDSIARLSFIQGKAFVQRASDLGYEEAALNMPISQGDRIGTSDGRLEVHFGRGNYIRLDNETKVDVLNLPKKDDDITRFRVWSGSIFIVVGTLQKEKSIELHTADSSFYVLDKGIYRIDVRENKDTEILVYQGLIEAAGQDGSNLLKAGQKLEIAEGKFAAKPGTFIPVADDAFDKFNESRTSVTGREFAQKRLPEELSDYEGELDDNGEWRYLAPYGNVWVPNNVDEDWRPYYDGRWTWLPLSGWTWWPYEPWGWATFHYGRWHWGVDMGWYWIPMNIWGPAWVDWWWDDWYFGWAPLSYWGYPGVFYGGMYYGHYYGPYYPNGSRAMTVVRRDSLKDPHIARAALKGDQVRSINSKITMTNKSPNLRPASNRISVQPLSGKQVMLRNDGSSGLVRAGGREAGGAASGPRAVRQPSDPGKSGGASSGAAAKPQSIKAPSSGKAGSSGSGKSSGGSAKTGGAHKKDEAPATSASSATPYRSDPAISSGSTRTGQAKTADGYPSSPRIKGPSSYSDGGSGRARTSTGPYSRPSSYGGSSSSGRSSGSSVRSGGSRSGSSSGRSSGSSVRSGGSRSGSSSGRSSGGASRSSGGSRSSGSSSRGSSGGGSRGSSGGGAHKK